MAGFIIKLMKITLKEDEIVAEGWVTEECPTFHNGFICTYHTGKSSLNRAYYSVSMFDYFTITPAFEEIEVKHAT